ncbi:hypothetical protein Gpo141_00012560 [Globisporangium polare]
MRAAATSEAAGDVVEKLAATSDAETTTDAVVTSEVEAETYAVVATDARATSGTLTPVVVASDVATSKATASVAVAIDADASDAAAGIALVSVASASELAAPDVVMMVDASTSETAASDVTMTSEAVPTKDIEMTPPAREFGNAEIDSTVANKTNESTSTSDNKTTLDDANATLEKVPTEGSSLHEMYGDMDDTSWGPQEGMPAAHAIARRGPHIQARALPSPSAADLLHLVDSPGLSRQIP